jgi:non-homologous end joining protein Ku
LTQSWSDSTSKKNAIAVLANQTNLRLEQESVVFVNAGIESTAAINSSKAAKGNVIDLVAALQESLGSVKKGKKRSAA